MALAVFVGICAGMAGFIPLWAALQATKRIKSTSNLSHASTLLIAVFVSVLILFGAVVLCIVVDRANILLFAFGEAGGIVAVAIIFGVTKFVQNKRQ